MFETLCSSPSGYVSFTNPTSAGVTCIYCSTQAEMDSVECVFNPDLPYCRNACSDYKDECESHGGSWQGSLTSDTTCASTCDLCGTPESQAMREYIYNSCCEGGLTPQYSCGFPGSPSSISGMVYSDVLSMGCNTANWETNKICDAFYEESSSSQNSSSSAASSVSEYCLLFPTDLACICAADSTHPDCQYLSSSASPGSSGSEGGEGSSGSGGEPCVGNGCGEGSSDSGGGSGGQGGTGDFEYDYRDSLHRIINATSKTAITSDSIKSNTNRIKNLLQQAKCLFQDCTDYDQLRMAFDSNMVIPDGDTAGVLGSMEELWDSTAMAQFIRGAEGGDIYGIDGDSVNEALGELGDKFGTAFGDTGGVYGEMSNYQDMIEDNFPTAQWSYTQNCPSVLTERLSFNIPPVGVVSTDKTLGKYFCEPLPPFNITAGNIVRAIIRLVLTITMAFGIFKAATGVKHE